MITCPLVNEQPITIPKTKNPSPLRDEGFARNTPRYHPDYGRKIHIHPSLSEAVSGIPGVGYSIFTNAPVPMIRAEGEFDLSLIQNRTLQVLLLGLSPGDPNSLAADLLLLRWL